jgi:hypothetical protein
MEARALEEVKPFASAEEEFAELKAWLQSQPAQALTHGALEEELQNRGREIQRRLLQAHLDLRSSREEPQLGLAGADGAVRTHRRRRSRKLVSLFGVVTWRRLSYGQRSGTSLSPLDGELNLPMESYSHGLRRLAAVEAARGSFDEAVAAIGRSTGAELPKRQVEQLVARAAQDFTAFYQRPHSERMAAADQLLVMSLDGKGIVMRPESLTELTRQAAAEENHKLRSRLSAGEKKNRKRMAAVAGIYDLIPHPRAAEDVLVDLRLDDQPDLLRKRPPRPRAQNKRIWASLELTTQEVVRQLFEEADRRDPQRQRAWVVLVDGDRGQIRKVRAEAHRLRVKVTLVADLIHVLEYLWQAAWSFFDNGDRRAESWVMKRADAILRGKASQVAAGMRRSATLRRMTAGQRRWIDRCANYLLAKKRLLHYDEYLRRGMPISTGVIEGACRHLICDRLDITGARWSLHGAEAILRLRSLRASGDLDAYWAFHLDAEHQRHHRARLCPAPARPPLRLIIGGASS